LLSRWLWGLVAAPAGAQPALVSSPRYTCNQKRRGLAAGAALVRKELAGR